MKVNLHGLLGTLAILAITLGGLLGDWFTEWQWWVFLLVLPFYAALVIGLSKEYEKLPDITLSLWLIGLHCAIIIFATGLWLDLPSRGTISILVLCLPVGLVIPRLLITGKGTQWEAKWDGLFGILALFAMIGIAFSKNWNIPLGYFIVVLLLYSLTMIALSTESGKREIPVVGRSHTLVSEILYCKVSYSFTEIRYLWGMHLSLLFSSGGMLTGMRAQTSILRNAGPLSTSLAYSVLLIASFAMGLAVPFILFRERS